MRGKVIILVESVCLSALSYLGVVIDDPILDWERSYFLGFKAKVFLTEKIFKSTFNVLKLLTGSILIFNQ